MLLQAVRHRTEESAKKLSVNTRFLEVLKGYAQVVDEQLAICGILEELPIVRRGSNVIVRGCVTNPLCLRERVRVRAFPYIGRNDGRGLGLAFWALSTLSHTLKEVSWCAIRRSAEGAMTSLGDPPD